MFSQSILHSSQFPTYEKRQKHTTLILRTISVLLWTIKILNFDRAWENLRTVEGFNFTNFRIDRVPGCSTKDASYSSFRKVVSNNCFHYLRQFAYDKTSPLFFLHNFNNFMEKELCTKFFGVLISSLEVTKFSIRHEWCHTRDCTKQLSLVFVNFMEKEHFTHFYGRFDNFSWTYEVAKFWMIKLCLDVSDVIHKNKHTLYVCLTYKLSEVWLMQYCFMMRKNHFKNKLFLWSQVPRSISVFLTFCW